MFPFLGGFGSSYNRLVKELSGDWDVWTVNPPGHGPSSRPPYRRLTPLVNCYLDGLNPVLKPGALFFGHSMGGVIAYHVLLAMGGQPMFGRRQPTDLVISASCAPRDLRVAGVAELPEPELLDHLLSFGMIPSEVVADRSLIDLFLPAIRADYEVLEDVKQMAPVQLDVPTRLVLGELDPLTPAGTAQAWQDYLAEPIQVHVLEREGHMFVLEAVDSLNKILIDG